MTGEGDSRPRLTHDLRTTTVGRFLDKATVGPQLAQKALLELELEPELALAVWSALLDEVAPWPGDQNQLVQQEQGKRRAQGKVKVARATTRGARRSV